MTSLQSTVARSREHALMKNISIKRGTEEEVAQVELPSLNCNFGQESCSVLLMFLQFGFQPIEGVPRRL